MTHFKPGDRVRWHDSPATVIGVMDQPSLILELDNGQRVAVGQSVASLDRQPAEPEFTDA